MGIKAGRWCMRRLGLCAAAALAVAFLGASSEGMREQLRFGNQAAKQNLWGEARFRWQKVLDAEPSNGAAHNNIGVALEREGRIEQALEHYRLAVKELPANTYARKNMQRCEELLKASRGSTEGAAK